ncbi:hypothetical protein [Chloroflexus aggregans]|uniref:hypothetical protein n=1 Tax=Chloroflexus aggregans TaxID=152260 RepID=UPI0012ED3BAE|nr:hypothetical protein [Chloroflexus aggregans]
MSEDELQGTAGWARHCRAPTILGDAVRRPDAMGDAGRRPDAMGDAGRRPDAMGDARNG